MPSTIANKLATGATLFAFVLALLPADALAAPPSGEVTAAPPMPAPAPAPTLTPAPQPMPVALPPAQDLPDYSWSQLIGKQINVQQTDGLFVYGQLLSVDATRVVILGSDNFARTVFRQQVYHVELLQPGGPTAATTTAPAAKPGKPPITDPARYSAGNGMLIGGGVVLGLGAIAFFSGFLVALGEWDAGYLLYITLPGAVAMVGIGMPLMLVGSGLKRDARQPVLTLRDRGGRTRAQLHPLGLRF